MAAYITLVAECVCPAFVEAPSYSLLTLSGFQGSRPSTRDSFMMRGRRLRRSATFYNRRAQLSLHALLSLSELDTELPCAQPATEG